MSVIVVQVPEGQGVLTSHQESHSPWFGFPAATQASPSPHVADPRISAHVAPAWSAPDDMQSKANPSVVQHVCPDGQS